MLLNVAPIVGYCNYPCFVVRYFVSNTSFAIRLMEKRELVALLSLSHDCCVALLHGVMGLSAVCDCGIS